MRNVQQIRASLLWGAPLCAALFALCAWYVGAALLPTLRDLQALAPSVRITPAAPMMVYGLVFALTLVAVVAINAVPCAEPVRRRAERFLLGVLLAGLATMLLCLAVVTPAQYYAMPRLGYTRCTLLQGHPSMYFTDWVRDPAWCVQGKSRAWVAGQALGTGPAQ